MNIPGAHSPQSQFEFFPHAPSPAPVAARSPYQLKSLTLTAENIIVLGIVFVMTLVLFFSFGFEKGKRLTRISLLEAAQVAAATDAPQGQAMSNPVPEPQETAVLKGGGRENLGEELAPSPKTPSLGTSAEEDIFTIQVASFKQQKDAQREATILKKKGYDSIVLSKGKHIIVCVGKFAQKDAAKQFSNRLKNKYTDCLVRRL